MSKQVGDYFWMKIKENYHINDSKFSSSHSEKVFSYICVPMFRNVTLKCLTEIGWYISVRR
jgi:hypothetical protein